MAHEAAAAVTGWAADVDPYNWGTGAEGSRGSLEELYIDREALGSRIKTKLFKSTLALRLIPDERGAERRRPCSPQNQMQPT